MKIEKGFVLVAALIVLVVIALMAASVIRRTQSGWQIFHNLKTEQQAGEYAQLALRYCENNLLNSSRSEVAISEGFASWRKPESWKKAFSPEIFSGLLSGKFPQCLAEIQIKNGNQPFPVLVITARGFSPDYQEDASGLTVKGIVVWVQSVYDLPKENTSAETPNPFAQAVPVFRAWKHIVNPPFN